MSTKKALLLSALIPLGLAMSLPAAAMGPGGNGGPGMDRPAFSDLDTNGDGQLTLEEITALRDSHFAAADTDGDGSLSRDEMIAMAMTRVEARIDDRMAQFDDNEDGLLSANELDDMRPRGPGPEQMFARADADGDGVVTEAEFDQMAAMGPQNRGPGGHGMMDGEGYGHRMGHGQGHGEGRGQGHGFWLRNGDAD